MDHNLNQLPMSDNFYVARTRSGQYVLAQKILQDGQERLKRVAYMDEQVALRAKRMLDRRVETQHGQNFKRLAKDPSTLARTSRGQDLIVALNGADVKTQMRIAARRPELIRFLADPPEAVLLAAVRAKPSVIRYVKGPAESLQMAAVMRDGLAIAGIPSGQQTEKVRMAAVNQNGLALRSIRGASPGVERAAVAHTPEAGRFAKVNTRARSDFER